MAYEIIYTCNSVNNKNVRRGELAILRKNEAELYFEFGESENNIKKRYYNDEKTLNKDYKELLKLKEKEENEEIEEEMVEESEEESEEEVKAEKPKKTNYNSKKTMF